MKFHTILSLQGHYYMIAARDEFIQEKEKLQSEAPPRADTSVPTRLQSCRSAALSFSGGADVGADLGC